MKFMSKSHGKQTSPSAYDATGKAIDIPISDTPPVSVGDETVAPTELTSPEAAPAKPESDLDLVKRVTELESELAKAIAERDDARNDVLRAYAEADTIRRRKNNELLDQKKYAPESLAKALLPALQDLERIVEHSEKSDLANLLEAVKMLQSSVVRALESTGVEKIVPERGSPFDPQLHEALSSMPATDIPDHSVAHLVEPGWKLHDHLLRAARVLVAIHPEG